MLRRTSTVSLLVLISLSLPSARGWSPAREALPQPRNFGGDAESTPRSLAALATGGLLGGPGAPSSRRSPQLLPLAFAGGLPLPGTHRFAGGLHALCGMQGGPRGRGAVLGRVRMVRNLEGDEIGGGRGEDGEKGGGLDKPTERRTERVARKARFLLDKWEGKVERFEARVERSLKEGSLRRVGAKFDKISSKLSSRKAKVKAVVALVSSDKKSIVLVVCAAVVIIPAAVATVGAVSSSLIFVSLFIQMVFILLMPVTMMVGAGLAVFQPVIVTSASMAFTVLAALSGLIVGYFPRTRNIKGLVMATILPLSSLWAATLPVASTSMEIYQGLKFVDPMKPMLMNPEYMQLFPDLFFSGFMDLVPKAYLVRGPVEVLTESMGPMPLFPLKVTISAAALAVAMYAWYSERHNLRSRMQGKLVRGGGSESVLSQGTYGGASELPLSEADVPKIDFAEESRKLQLKEWEERFKLRPASDANPAKWSVDDLFVELRRAGLEDCSDSLRDARIDGRVAMTLTSADERDVRDELGVTSLGERRRLLLFCADLRERQRLAEQTPGAKPEPPDVVPGADA